MQVRADQPWPLEIPASSTVGVCQGQPSVPHLGTMVMEGALAVVHLFVAVANGVLNYPGVVAMWRIQNGVCPLQSQGHSAIASCGASLFDLSDYFDSLDDMNAALASPTAADRERLGVCQGLCEVLEAVSKRDCAAHAKLLLEAQESLEAIQIERARSFDGAAQRLRALGATQAELLAAVEEGHSRFHAAKNSNDTVKLREKALQEVQDAVDGFDELMRLSQDGVQVCRFGPVPGLHLRWAAARWIARYCGGWARAWRLSGVCNN
jgi:hypothetical protein